MRIAGLCLTLPLLACAGANSSSLPSSAGSELDECTGLVRGLMKDNIALEASRDSQAVNASAELSKCSARASAAEKMALKNEWMARFGLPLGVGITAAIMGSILATLEALRK